ncbi:MAG: hypothetical protein OEO82_07140 [Gammaproteobacteria bacterium]|nr:hypothetical protein [Gammaproteobacteria bacterium]
MPASHEVMKRSAADIAMEMTASMEAYAASGEWQRVEEIAAKLRNTVTQVAEDQRRETLLAVRRSIESVQTLASNARHDVTEKLSAIHRGKTATRAYAATD